MKARQEFLKQIYRQNPEISRWLHFGDLDPDGRIFAESMADRFL